uniref:Dynein heavy chain hydrolytic ATP-binding dynein motor region domain-containing protein n=1 Tax=Amphimedon queenslandica TaxID=400682 RepID=A0A1X7TCB0_AMPQE
MAWEALKKSINRLINKVNVSNIANIVKELVQENLVRGRGLFALAVITAQSASPTFTKVYATLVAVIDVKFPQETTRLFVCRLLAMTKPDRPLIAQVMLYSQGFRTAETLTSKIGPFFKLCDEELSNQSHYDFGLRALKSVLVSAGNIKRDRIQQLNQELAAQGQTLEETDLSKQLHEQEDEQILANAPVL